MEIGDIVIYNRDDNMFFKRGDKCKILDPDKINPSISIKARERYFYISNNKAAMVVSKKDIITLEDYRKKIIYKIIDG